MGRIRLKICGVSDFENAVAISRIGVDYIGVVTEPVSPRYAGEDFVDRLKKAIETPVVSVKVKSSIESLASSRADYIQIHRVLSPEEIEALTVYDTKRFIIYVPASLDYLDYLKTVQKYFDLILFDSPVKGVASDTSILRVMLEHHRGAGVAGGITLENIHRFLELEPGWIDVSSGVEVKPGVKDLAKVKKLKEVIDSWSGSL